MIRKLTLLAALASIALSLTATPTLAAQVDADDDYTPLVVVATVNPDGSVTLSGDNCPPNTTVEYVVRRGSANPSGNTPIIDQGSGQADENGDFSVTTAVLPRGRHSITVTCGDKSTVLSVNTAQGGGNLATTGTDSSIPMARLGMILIAAGGVAVYAAKKRQGRRAAFINA